MTNQGTLEDPVILPGMKVTGGKLTGMVIALGSYENVVIAPNTTIITQVDAIPPETFKRSDAQTMTILPISVLSQITPAQFAQIPIDALSGLTSQNMGALSPAVIATMSNQQIAALQPDAFKQMPTDGVAKFLTNFDPTAITQPEAEKLLPQGWHTDAQGNLTAPPDSAITLKSLQITAVPAGLDLPDQLDLNSSFALHGKGSQSIGTQLSQVGQQNNFTLLQQPLGVIQATVAGSEANPSKNKFAFMIDPNHLFILDEKALRGLQINEQGQYVIVTQDGKQIPIMPMTQDPAALLSVLGKGSTVDILPTGEVLLKYIPIKRMRDGGEVHSVGMFDPFIEPAPEDICDESGCHWDQADASMQPGLRTAKGLRAKSAAKIIYPDGTAQKLYPAVLFPELLVAEAKKIKGVKDIIFRMDGTFAVTYQGVKLLLVPEFATQVHAIPAGQEAQASLVLQPDNSLLYQVPYRGQLFTTTLLATESTVKQ